MAAYVLSQQSGGSPGKDVDHQTVFTSDGQYGTTTLDITFRQSVSLTEKNGRIPERENAKAWQKALESAGWDYDIRIGFDPMDPPSEVANCSNESPLRWFKDKMDTGDYGHVGNDVNLLLLDTKGGGCSWVLGKYGIVNAAEITEERPYSEIGPKTDGQHQALYASLHEGGHQLGAVHNPWNDKGNIGQWRQQHVFADAWTDEQGRFVKTPNYGGGNFQNACGKEVPPQHQPVYLKLKFSECTKANWVIN